MPSLYLKKIELNMQGGQTFTHRVLYNVIEGGAVIPSASRNIAVATQDAMRIYLGICTPVSIYFRYNNQSSLNLKMCTGLTDILPRVLWLTFGTATSSDGNWTAKFQVYPQATCVPGPFDYTAPCMTGTGPKPR